MESRTIYGTEIEHNGDVDNGLEYLKRNWNTDYVADVFENAYSSYDRVARFRIPGSNERGSYVLKYIAQKHYSLSWDE